MLLPAFVLIELRGRAPMLDLTIFHNRMFSAATAAAFINGLSRFALLFVFVFYFQGVKGDEPIDIRDTGGSDQVFHAEGLHLAGRRPSPLDRG